MSNSLRPHESQHARPPCPSPTPRVYPNSYPLGEGSGTPLPYSCLENPMDRGAWWAAVHGVATSGTRLINFTFTFHFHALEEEMATHSSILAWRIPGTGEPDGLLSMGSHRVGHDWSELAAAVAATQDGDSESVVTGPLFPYRTGRDLRDSLIHCLHFIEEETEAQRSEMTIWVAG